MRYKNLLFNKKIRFCLYGLATIIVSAWILTWIHHANYPYGTDLYPIFKTPSSINLLIFADDKQIATYAIEDKTVIESITKPID